MRRRFITHPQFQLGFTFAFIRGVFVAIFLPVFALFLTGYLLAQDPAMTANQKAFLLEGCNRMAVTFFWLALLLCSVFGALGAYLSYKFVGPLHRMESWLRERLADPSTAKISLRSGDELSAVANVVNRLFNR